MSDKGPDDLSARIAAARRVQAEREGRPSEPEEQDSSNAGALAVRYSAEFAASVIVGIGLGLLIDYFAGTRPWGLLIMLLVGLAAGVLSVYRAYREITAEAARLNKDEPQGSNEEETR